MGPSWTPSDDGFLAGLMLPTTCCPGRTISPMQLGVSRTSIREAVKVLSAKGLLQARRRVGVRVRDRDDWNLLDPQVLSWHPDVGRDEALINKPDRGAADHRARGRCAGGQARDRGGSRPN